MEIKASIQTASISNQKSNLILCKLGANPDSGILILSNYCFSIPHEVCYKSSLLLPKAPSFLFVYIPYPIEPSLQLNSFSFLPVHLKLYLVITSFLSRPILLFRKIPLSCTINHALAILYFQLLPVYRCYELVHFSLLYAKINKTATSSLTPPSQHIIIVMQVYFLFILVHSLLGLNSGESCTFILG